MRSSPSFPAFWTFLNRRGFGLMMVLLALTAAGGFWSWWQPSQPRATWEIVNAGNGANLTGDGRILYGMSQKEIHTQSGYRSEWPVGPVRLWDAATGQERLRVAGDGDRLSIAGISPDGRWLAVADRQGGLAVWEVATGRQHAVLTPFLEGNDQTPGFTAILFSPDSRLLAQEQADRKAVVLWEVDTGQRHAHLEDARWPLWFAPDGRTLATAAGDKAGKLWDVATGQERSRFEGRTAPIHSLIFSPDGRFLATDHFDPPHSTFTEVNVWQADSGQLWANIPLTPGTAQNPTFHHPLTFSPDSRMLIVSGTAVDCPLWDITTAPPKSLEKRIVDYCDQDKSAGEAKLRRGIQLVFSPDGRSLAVPGKQPGTLTIFDAATLSPQSVLALHSKGGWPRFSPDGRTIAVETQYLKRVYRVGNNWQDLLNYLLGRPVGQRRVSTVRLFEADTGRPLGDVPGSWWGGFTPDGQSFFTAVGTDEYLPGAPLVVHRYSLPLDRPAALYAGLSALLLFLIGSLFWGGSRLQAWFLDSCRFRRANSTTAPAGSSS